MSYNSTALAIEDAINNNLIMKAYNFVCRANLEGDLQDAPLCSFFVELQAPEGTIIADANERCSGDENETDLVFREYSYKLLLKKMRTGHSNRAEMRGATKNTSIFDFADDVRNAVGGYLEGADDTFPNYSVGDLLREPGENSDLRLFFIIKASEQVEVSNR